LAGDPSTNFAPASVLFQQISPEANLDAYLKHLRSPILLVLLNLTSLLHQLLHLELADLDFLLLSATSELLFQFSLGLHDRLLLHSCLLAAPSPSPMGLFSLIQLYLFIEHLVRAFDITFIISPFGIAFIPTFGKQTPAAFTFEPAIIKSFIITFPFVLASFVIASLVITF